MDTYAITALVIATMFFILVSLYLSSCNNEHQTNVLYIDDESNKIVMEEEPDDTPIIDKLTGKFKDKIDFKINKRGKNFFIKLPHYQKYDFQGKGIVIAASGLRYKYVTGLYMNIYVIRKLFKSNIPIEIVYVGQKEKFNEHIQKKIMELGHIKIIDLTEKLNTNLPEKKLKGYRTKPLAVLASSFKEVILMDADALCFIDPNYFFNIKGYQTHGMVLFKDYVKCLKYVNKKFINNIGIGYETFCEKTHGLEIDSSCIIINKEIAWEALHTICLINVESKAYYNKTFSNVLGDKDTWLIGSLFCEFEPYVINSNPGSLVCYDQTNDNSFIIFGHLQFQMVSGEDIPLYYNNQKVNFVNYNGMEHWGYIEDVIEPKMYESCNDYYKPLTPEMKDAFYTASIAVKDIYPYLGIPGPSRISSYNNMIADDL